jgi:ABC-type multidrug transport system fused ATPase/permease subunit
LFSLTGSAGAVTIGIFGSLIALISDLAVLIVLGAGLFIVNPTLAFATASFFGLVGFALYRLMAGTSQNLGAESSRLSIESNEIMTEALSSFREVSVGNKQSFYVAKIKAIRLRMGNIMADIAFLPNISKYVIESALVLGALAVGGFVFFSKDATSAVANIAIFAVAGSRIAPAVLRLQQGLINIQGAFGAAGPALKLLAELPVNFEFTLGAQNSDFVYEGFDPSVEIENVNLTYNETNTSALLNINLKINAGEVVALVGASGAGKTSLVDVILGLIDPDRGEVKISGITPKDAIAKWPGAIGYVPQDIIVANATIRENVALGFAKEFATEDLVKNALKKAQLLDFALSLPNGLDSYVGDRGTQISGGQRQRLGIARALFTNPKFLVLDEATSTLDGETEYLLAESWNNLKGEVTVLIIAHRLSSIRNSDKIIYLENGRIRATGTFDQVRTEVKDFALQAERMGIKD